MVGHSLESDFEYLKLNTDEYQCEMRDISHFSEFRKQGWGKRKLKDLSAEFLNGEI